MRALLFLFLIYPSLQGPLDPVLLRAVYTATFQLRDGSVLASVDVFALNAMRGNLQRLLGVGNASEELLPAARGLPDDRLLGILLLAVAGNFTVQQSSALSQDCGIVINPGTGALMLNDSSSTQSVILEVLLIVSIVCLLRAWSDKK